MPTSMPMYTTFFMPVADRPMMVAMSRKSGSSARNRLGMFLSSSTSMSSSVATKCSPRAWARLSENLMIRQLTAIAMMELTIPMMGAAVSETPQPLAALIHAIAGTPGIIAMVNEQVPSVHAAQNSGQGMSHSRNIGRASGMSANMATNIEMPA